MHDEFAAYVEDVSNFHISTDDEAMLIWGEDAGREDADVIGFSYNSPVDFEDFTNTAALRCLCRFGSALDVPVLWIGKERFDDGVLQIGQVNENANASIEKTDLDEVGLDEAEQEIQDAFGTQYTEFGTSKPENKRLAGGFHSWSRDVMPKDHTKTDIDILVGDEDDQPRGFVEIKRSYNPRRWTPYRDDIRNYVMQYEASTEAGIAPVLVQHEKSKITGDSRVGYYDIQDVNPGAGNWMDTDKDVIPAKEARRRLERL